MTTWPAAPSTSVDSQAGFTLIELLVSITLLGLLLAGLIAGLSTGARVWERSEAQSSRTQDLQLVHRVLSDLISRAFPAVIEQDGELLYVFEGRSDHLRFVAFMPPFLDAGGLNQVTLSVVNRGEGYQLRLLRRAFEDLEIDTIADAEDTLLFESEATISFAYFGSSRTVPEPAWTDDWKAEDSPPQLVRLKVGNLDQTSTSWPDLVVSILIDTDLPCVSPGFIGRCRLLEAKEP